MKVNIETKKHRNYYFETKFVFVDIEKDIITFSDVGLRLEVKEHNHFNFSGFSIDFEDISKIVLGNTTLTEKIDFKSINKIIKKVF